MIKKIISRMNVYAVYTCAIFIIMCLSVGLASGIHYYLKLEGITKISYKTAYVEASVVLLAISCIIGLVVTAVGSRIILSPIRKMLNAMKELAGGNFNVRIGNKGWFRPKEICEFADQFNSTAAELAGIELLRSDFINNFSHEFKTPIVSLRGFARLLKDGNLTAEETAEYLDIIISESDRLASLSTNVLNLSKIENQAMIAKRVIFNLSEQIRCVVLMMDSKWSGKNLELDIDLEEVSYEGDMDLLNQVWVNVLDNAVKFSGEGGKIEIRLTDGRTFITVSMRDYGCGMNEETQAHLFDKFYQGDKSRSVEGNGIGLAVVEKIVSLHRGEITVKSEYGKGTLFMVKLPRPMHNSNSLEK